MTMINENNVFLYKASIMEYNICVIIKVIYISYSISMIDFPLCVIGETPELNAENLVSIKTIIRSII